MTIFGFSSSSFFDFGEMVEAAIEFTRSTTGSTAGGIAGRRFRISFGVVVGVIASSSGIGMRVGSREREIVVESLLFWDCEVVA